MDDVTFSRRVFDRDGHQLRMTLSRDEKYRVFTPLDQISPQLVQATLLARGPLLRRTSGRQSDRSRCAPRGISAGVNSEAARPRSRCNWRGSACTSRRALCEVSLPRCCARSSSSDITAKRNCSRRISILRRTVGTSKASAPPAKSTSARNRRSSLCTRQSRSVSFRKARRGAPCGCTVRRTRNSRRAIVSTLA